MPSPVAIYQLAVSQPGRAVFTSSFVIRLGCKTTALVDQLMASREYIRPARSNTQPVCSPVLDIRMFMLKLRALGLLAMCLVGASARLQERSMNNTCKAIEDAISPASNVWWPRTYYVPLALCVLPTDASCASLYPLRQGYRTLGRLQHEHRRLLCRTRYSGRRRGHCKCHADANVHAR